jgi:tetratricopeptide (TPR) repeat protein
VSVRLIGAEQLGFGSIIKNFRFPFEVLSRFAFPFMLPVVPTWSVFFSVVGLFIAAGLGVLFYSRRNGATPSFILGCAWFVAFLLPNMYVWLVTTPWSYDYLVHRAYMPLAGIFILLLPLVPGQWLEFANRRYLAVFAALVVLLAGSSFMQGTKYRDAKTFWNSAISDNPERAWYYHFLGRYYFRQQDYTTFEKYTRKAISLKDDPRFLYNLGLVSFLDKKQYDTAFKYFGLARARGLQDKESTRNYFDLCVESARNFFEKGEYRKAVERCMLGVYLDSLHPVACYNLGLYMAYDGEVKSAVHWWHRTIELDPDRREAYLSLYYYHLNNTKLADSAAWYAREFTRRGGVIPPPPR